MSSLTAWLLSTKNSKQKVFLKGLESCFQPLGGKELRKITVQSSNSSIAGEVQGGGEINSTSQSLDQVAEFLTDLFSKGLKYRTIAGYRSMLSNILPPVDKFSVGQHPYIVRLIKGVFNSRPPITKLIPEWDLHIVLNMLEKSPFEPLENKN